MVDMIPILQGLAGAFAISLFLYAIALRITEGRGLGEQRALETVRLELRQYRSSPVIEELRKVGQRLKYPDHAYLFGLKGTDYVFSMEQLMEDEPISFTAQEVAEAAQAMQALSNVMTASFDTSHTLALDKDVEHAELEDDISTEMGEELDQYIARMKGKMTPQGISFIGIDGGKKESYQGGFGFLTCSCGIQHVIPANPPLIVKTSPIDFSDTDFVQKHWISISIR